MGKIQIESLGDDLRSKRSEATQLLESSSLLQAELQDLKFQLESESAAARRQAAEASDMQAKLRSSEEELSSMRKRLFAAEEHLVRVEEEAKAIQIRAASGE